MRVTVFYCETDPRGMRPREVDVPGLEAGVHSNIIAASPFVKQNMTIARRVVIRYFPARPDKRAELVVHWQGIPTPENPDINIHYCNGHYIYPDSQPDAWDKAWKTFNERAAQLMSLAAPDEE